MLTAMAITAALCLLIGIVPGSLYSILPFSVEYEPYTTSHVITQIQLLFLASMAFTWLNRTGIYPPELRSTNLDFDYTYRRLLPAVVGVTLTVGSRACHELTALVRAVGSLISRGIYRLHGPEGVFARTWSTGAIAFWAVLGLGFYLLLYFLL
jgi:multicomponent Na+:H+ antiporter subunit D